MFLFFFLALQMRLINSLPLNLSKEEESMFLASSLLSAVAVFSWPLYWFLVVERTPGLGWKMRKVRESDWITEQEWKHERQRLPQPAQPEESSLSIVLSVRWLRQLLTVLLFIYTAVCMFSYLDGQDWIGDALLIFLAAAILFLRPDLRTQPGSMQVLSTFCLGMITASITRSMVNVLFPFFQAFLPSPQLDQSTSSYLSKLVLAILSSLPQALLIHLVIYTVLRLVFYVLSTEPAFRWHDSSPSSSASSSANRTLYLLFLLFFSFAAPAPTLSGFLLFEMESTASQVSVAVLVVVQMLAVVWAGVRLLQTLEMHRSDPVALGVEDEDSLMPEIRWWTNTGSTCAVFFLRCWSASYLCFTLLMALNFLIAQI